MAKFTVSEVCLAVQGSLIGGFADITFAGVSTDTRTLKAGDLFIALSGERFDGHEFLHQAAAKGAAGVLISRRDIAIPLGLTVILTDDTRKALRDLARFHRLRFDIPVIAITGSNGKTTTKDMTAAVLSSRFKVLKTEANFNNEIGLPLTLLNLMADHQVAVVEMGMRGKGEIRELAEIALPNVGVVTNVGETHIELLGSLENIASAKAELVEAVKDGLVVLNADNPYVYAMQSKSKAAVTLYGLTHQADVRAEDIRSDGEQTFFDCHYRGQAFAVVLPAIGRHNVYNALAAIAIGLALGLTPEEIAAGLKKFVPSGMRQHIEKKAGYTIINDAYNASPLSMQSAIETLAEIAGGRKIAVLGDMLELGQVAKEAHRRVGKQLAEIGVDTVITVGTLARDIAVTAKACGVACAIACDTHEEAKDALRQVMQVGDTILVKGSRGMKMEKVLDVFDAL
ncbi:UDP-N-acetylmuramoyl-tripeptide--D-alanyl-D-alanine ligase [Sporolituus thermophilus]|uniref:UDP-N-acetylmuramoyl-tripeptide--D-alanyl-D-alanine ligase n=1 Tax=Sporolituus thermophilus DSM 23256 TaxID=1123285 RepID=A0A1G7I3J7_9FIRM|nr:UDP-N-acetylmuramoyl-tripeptide--D-alanyl-D-alanine ligase [Sporolituus thermophilus]SDF07255.1 UDP-N-acetylmuramoyl-tripeptide--D-alanyl-D-alanine ligase [Sporolituus thermophilus DSM 23256]